MTAYPVPSSILGWMLMLNSVDAGRRLMLRAAVYPFLAVVALALVFLLISTTKTGKSITYNPTQTTEDSCPTA